MGALGSVLHKLFSPVSSWNSRSAAAACRDERALRLDWERASEPCSATTLELLDLYEERKAEARHALASHRQACQVCRGEVRSNPYASAPETEGSLQEEPSFHGEEPLHHNKEAA